ncbi:MAG: diaminopimelate decarboxylase [Clostridia bacterium]|nr:diaminopimelate decarboxylase [Clostridia bacterium]
MFDSNHMSVNAKNHLVVGGCDTISLAEKHGTPLYVLDEEILRENCRNYKESLQTHFGVGNLLYAGKALCNTAVLQIIKQEGLGLDVVSGGELYTAKNAGFPMQNVYFHGNNKTKEELSLALSLDVGHFVVDNDAELMRLNLLARDMGKTASVLLRIKPGVDAHTHDYIRTGQIDSKFGYGLETGEALEAVELAIGMNHIDFCGLHCHIGSQIFETEPYCEAARLMMRFIYELENVYHITVQQLNLGGGFGIAYTKEDDPLPFEEFCKVISEALNEEAHRLGMDFPYILMEPGRSIVAPAGTTLYTVGSVKEIPGVRTYVAVDGGMADNPRYSLYGAKYDFTCAGCAGDEKTKTVTIAGKCCESGDLLGEHVALQPVMAGDILAVADTGAYNYSMASHYNRIPNAAMVLVKNGTDRVIVKREQFEDVVRNDVFLEEDA